MEAMTRATWTDERMDDLNGRVDDLGRRMDRQFEHLMARLEKAEERTTRQFERLDAKIDAFQLAIIRVGGGLIATMALGFAGLLVR
jgi:flagellar capping protein FliD